MTVFMADRDLPGMSLEQLAAAQRAAIETSRRFTAEGRPVRYIRSTWVPGDSRVMCLFEADDAGLVEEVNRSAGIPFSRVVAARDLTPISRGTKDEGGRS
jgi:muconolactone delta-isomerase